MTRALQRRAVMPGAAPDDPAVARAAGDAARVARPGGGGGGVTSALERLGASAETALGDPGQARGAVA